MSNVQTMQQSSSTESVAPQSQAASGRADQSDSLDVSQRPRKECRRNLLRRGSTRIINGTLYRAASIRHLFQIFAEALYTGDDGFDTDDFEFYSTQFDGEHIACNSSPSPSSSRQENALASFRTHASAPPIVEETERHADDSSQTDFDDEFVAPMTKRTSRRSLN